MRRTINQFCIPRMWKRSRGKSQPSVCWQMFNLFCKRKLRDLTIVISLLNNIISIIVTRCSITGNVSYTTSSNCSQSAPADTVDIKTGSADESHQIQYSLSHEKLDTNCPISNCTNCNWRDHDNLKLIEKYRTGN